MPGGTIVIWRAAWCPLARMEGRIGSVGIQATNGVTVPLRRPYETENLYPKSRARPYGFLKSAQVNLETGMCPRLSTAPKPRTLRGKTGVSFSKERITFRRFFLPPLS